MNLAAEGAQGFILVLCRIGSCLMLLPGYGSIRVPMRFRLLIAVALTLALASFVLPQAQAALRQAGGGQEWSLMAREVVNGATLGLLVRLLMLALQTAATLITNVIGLAPTPGAPIDDLEPSPPLVTLITMAATMLVLAARLEHKMIAALIESYALVAIGQPFDAGWYLEQIVTRLDVAWSLALRLAAPFVVYSVIVNLAIGLANKFTPQISVYFITTGLVAAGGLILLFVVVDDMYGVFLQEFSGFLE